MLAAMLQRDYVLPDAAARTLAASLRRKRFETDAFIMRSGQRDGALYFIEAGIWRVFYPTADGREYNKAFVSEGMCFVALSAHLQGTPVAFDVQAMTGGVAWAMPYADFERKCDHDPSFAGLWRRYMQAHFVRHESREAALQQLDAEGRYAWFLERHPTLADRIPQYQVASYLGLTPVTLSRVRRARADAPPG